MIFLEKWGYIYLFYIYVMNMKLESGIKWKVDWIIS